MSEAIAYNMRVAGEANAHTRNVAHEQYVLYLGGQTSKVQLVILNQISQTWMYCSLLIKNLPVLSV